jgi:hypothetical protein
MRRREVLLVLAGAAIFAASCGSGALSDPRAYEAGLQGHYERTDDPRRIVVSVVVGRDHEVIGSSTREDATTVSITVHARNPNPSGWSDLAGYTKTVVVGLQAPLGDRTVIDARTGSRIQDLAVSVARREVGVIDRSSYRASNGSVDFRWSDSKGTHALSELLGSTVVLLTRGVSYEQQGDSKQNMLALADHLSKAPDAERAKTFVFVINFDRAEAVAPDDDPFRPLFADPSGVTADAPEILQPSAPTLMWFIGPDGRLRERIVGAASGADVARALVSSR